MMINLLYCIFRDELQIGGVFIRIYNEMPTFPIMKPKQLTLDLLRYLKQASLHLKKIEKQQNILHENIASDSRNNLMRKNHHSSSNASGGGVGGSSGFQRQPIESRTESTFDEVLNAYNRSKTRKKLENNAISLEQEQLQNDSTGQDGGETIHTFSENRTEFEENITMVLKALVAVMKSNTEVEIQCIGNFAILFGFLSDNLLKEVIVLLSFVVVNT